MTGKKFRFSLDRVLRLREHEKRMAREELASIRQQMQEQELRVEEARRRLDDLFQQVPRGAVAPHVLRQFDQRRLDAQHAYQEARARLQHLTTTEEEARARLMEKRSAEETLRHLHDEEKARHTRETEHAEASFLDEQALTSFYRQRKATN